MIVKVFLGAAAIAAFAWLTRSKGPPAEMVDYKWFGKPEGEMGEPPVGTEMAVRAAPSVTARRTLAKVLGEGGDFEEINKLAAASALCRVKVIGKAVGRLPEVPGEGPYLIAQVIAVMTDSKNYASPDVGDYVAIIS